MKTMMSLALLFATVSPGFGQANQSDQAEIFGAMDNRLQLQRQAWFDAGRFPVTAQILEFEVLFFPHDYDRVTSLGWMYGNMEMTDEEIRVYNWYRKTFPNDAEAHYPAGEFYFRRREYEKVIPIILPSLSLKNKPHGNSYRILANAYDRLKKYKESMDIWNQFLKIEPNDPTALRNRDKVKKLLEEQKSGGGH